MDFVWKLYGNTYAVHVTVALVGVATLNLALPAPPWPQTRTAMRPHFGARAIGVALVNNLPKGILEFIGKTLVLNERNKQQSFLL